MADEKDRTSRWYSDTSHKLFLFPCALKQKCDFLMFS